MVTPVIESRVGINPYVGPRAFQTGEHLYGRERESAELVDLLIAERIVLLYSPSGAGKSSLINARVIPEMQKANFIIPQRQDEGNLVPVTIRVHLEAEKGAEALKGFNRYTSSFMRSLEDSFPRETQCSAEKLAGMTLADYIQDYRRRASGQFEGFDPEGALVLVIDQLEEMIRINAADREAKAEFFTQLGEMLRDRSLWALIAIREDYLAAFEPYSRPIPNRLSVKYRLDFLDATAAIQAVQGPAKESGVTFEDEAAKELVKNLRKIRVQQADGNAVEQDGPYVEPVQLQVVCRRLWDKAADREAITLKDVTDAGNIDDALGEYYASRVEEAAKQSGTSEREIREWFDRRLIAVSGIRSQVLMEQGSSGDLANTTIKLLQEAYLVRADRRGNAIWFELAHDRLTRPIRQSNADWFGAHLNVFQRQADVWNTQKRPDSLLLKGPAFLEAEEWAKAQTQPLPKREEEFLEASRKAHQALLREQRLNLLVRGAALLMTLLALAALAFFVRAQRAERTAVLNAQRADQSAAEAKQNADVAEQERQKAEISEQAAKQSSQIAHVRELAAQSLSSLGVDPELSVRLALQAGQSADLTQPEMEEVAKSVEEALRQALPAMRVEQVMRDPVISTTESMSHTGSVWSVAFDPMGRQVASAGDEGTVKVWDSRNGKLLHTITVFTPSTPGRGVMSVAWSPDGKRLAAATGNGKVVLYDTANFAITDTLAIQEGAIWAVAFIPVDANRPVSNHLLIGGERGLAEILDLEAGGEPVVIKGHAGNVRAVAFSPDGRWVATGDGRGAILVSDATNGNPVFPAMEQTGSVNGVAFRSDGKQLVTASGSDRLLHIWDLTDNGQEVVSISGHRDAVYQVAFTQDGGNVISVSVDRTIRFWDAIHGRQVMILNGHKDQVFALVLSPDGNRIATGSKDRSVRVWNISPEGSRELITFDIGASVRDIAISPDGGELLEGGLDSTARVLNATSGQIMFTLTGHTNAVEGVAFSSDGKKLLTCSRDGTAKIWDSTSGKQLANFSEHKGAIWDCALSKDGKKAATAGQDQTVKVWDPGTGKLLQNLAYQGEAALAVAWSPDSQLVAAGYANYNIVLWNADTGENLSVLSGHTDRLQVLAFRPDGQVLASAAEDGNIILWDMNPERWGQYQPAMRDRGDAILDLGFSSDGKFLFSAGTDGIGTLWDLENRHPDFHTYGHADRIYAAEISPDGNFLYSSSRDGTIRAHVYSLQGLLKLAEKRTSRQFTEEECRQYLSAACPAEAAPLAAAPPPPTTGGGPAAPEIKTPPDAVSSDTDSKIGDENSSSTAADAQANGGDQFELGRFERPFNSGEMNIYYPDVDIVSASLTQNTTQVDFRNWMVATITLAGLRGDSLQGNYGIEMDLNADGRGDLLITTLTPGKEWSASGVRIWADKNRSVGNELPYLRDGPQVDGDGYETLIFDQGSGEQRDLAWSRLAPNDANSIQIALQRSVIQNDPQFVWIAWASREPLRPAWFDYNDRFTFEQAGSPLKTQPQFYPLGELEGVDNTCRQTVGFEPTAGQQVFCRR